jgi:carbamoyltransferase
MEFGPRALGDRSIIGDPRNPKMQSVMNLKIKYRESFRPFAPSVLAEKVGDYFELDRSSPYMLLVAQVKENLRLTMTDQENQLFGIEKLNIPRSTLPAITHVDYSARIQTVQSETNPRYYQLLQAFEQLTGCGVLVNTSFNVRGEPIVCTPEDAYRCFMRTEMDYLVLENYILAKTEQPQWQKDDQWQKEFELD